MHKGLPLSSYPSVFPSLTPPDPAAQVREVIARTRAQPKPPGAEQRTAKRLSIDELNGMDTDALRERFHSTRYDDRGPIVKALDLLDAPRNELMGVLFSGIEKRKREAGETGTFGSGKVYFSDVLNDMGVKNKVVRGVVGFIGDVALDPLTYAGPAGWGFKASNAAGQGVRVGLRGKRAVQQGIKAVKAGGEAADPTVRALFNAAGGTNAADISQNVLGNVTSGRIGKAFSKVGGDLDRKGGILAEQFDQFGKVGPEAAQADAARAFVRQYGKGSAPGVRIGRDASGKVRVTVGKATADGPVATSTIAHIPFTEYGIHVPAFSRDGRAAADAFRIAHATGRMEPLRAAGPTVQAVQNLVRQMQDVASGAAVGDVDAIRQQIEQTIRAGASPAQPDNIGELLAIKRLTDEAEASAASAKRMATIADDPDVYQKVAEANLRLADVARGSVVNFANQADESARRIARRFLEVDDDIMGTSALASFAEAARGQGDPGIAADIAHRIDRGTTRTFGPGEGMLRSVGRYFRNTMTTGARETFLSTEKQLRGEILDAMRTAGYGAVKPDDYLKASQVAFAHMFALRNAENPGEAVFHTTKFGSKFGSKEDAEWVSLLKQAQEGGLFGQGVEAQKLNEALKEIASRNVGVLDSLGDMELTDDILGQMLRGYVPNAITPEARARIQQTMEYPLRLKRGESAGAPDKARGMAAEAFQKQRSTLQYRFKNAEGQDVRFFEKDRWVTSVSDAELEAIRQSDPSAASRIEELQDTIRQYDGDPTMAEKFPPRNTDPWELNELVRDGHFSLLLGADELPGGFADTNIATVMATRAMSHERSVARRTWLEYASTKGITVDANLRGQWKDKEALILPDGSQAKFYEDHRTNEWGVEMLGQRYRPLKKSIQGLAGNPIIEGIGQTRANLYHEDVARMLEDAAQIYEEQGETLLKWLDQFTGIWKASALAHPSWTINNIAGDTINSVMGGAKIEHFAKHGQNAMRLLVNMNDPEKLRGITFNVRGVEVSGEELVNDLRAQRMLGTNAAAETALQLIGRQFFVMPSMIAGREAQRGIKGVAQAMSPAALKGDFLQRLSFETAAGKSGAGAKAKAAGFVARDRFMSRVVGPWFRLNERVGDYVRMLTYLSHLEQGHDMASAVQRTIRSTFDYSDMARTERHIFRRVFPFYSWMRLNGAYQIKLLMERPIYAGSFPLVQNAVEESISGDQRVPTHARPGWMRNQLAIMAGQEDRSALILGQSLPTEQALAAIQGVTGPEGMQDFLRYFVSSLSPAMRIPLELGTRREVFSGRTIGEGEDVGLGQYATNQVRPLREIGKVSNTLSEQGVAPAITRGFLGGRVQPATDERLAISREREFTEREQKLRRAVARAERTGDKATSLVRRAELLSLYQAMQQGGFDIPNWAAERLAQMGAA
jgi:hypothetical protein